MRYRELDFLDFLGEFFGTFGRNFLGIFENFWEDFLKDFFGRNFLQDFFWEDDLFVNVWVFVKILGFFKILSQGKKEGRKFQSLEVRVQAYRT